jgi:hypothetical protein
MADKLRVLFPAEWIHNQSVIEQEQHCCQIQTMCRVPRCWIVRECLWIIEASGTKGNTTVQAVGDRLKSEAHHLA